jgi:hypothetical protein
MSLARDHDDAQAAPDAGIPDPSTTPFLELWPTTGRFLKLGRSATYQAAARGEIVTVTMGARKLVPTNWLRSLARLDDSKSA